MILVAGGTGFVGGGIVRELRRRGHGVAVLTRDSKRAASRFGDLGVELREGDVRDPTSLGPTLRGSEVVIGCQQFPNSPIENPSRGYTFEEVDAKGTENLVAAAKASGAKRYIYLSGLAPPPMRHTIGSGRSGALRRPCGKAACCIPYSAHPGCMDRRTGPSTAS